MVLVLKAVTGKTRTWNLTIICGYLQMGTCAFAQNAFPVYKQITCHIQMTPQNAFLLLMTRSSRWKKLGVKKKNKKLEITKQRELETVFLYFFLLACEGGGVFFSNFMQQRMYTMAYKQGVQ